MNASMVAFRISCAYLILYVIALYLESGGMDEKVPLYWLCFSPVILAVLIFLPFLEGVVKIFKQWDHRSKGSRRTQK